jgi:hypothetical protein
VGFYQVCGIRGCGFAVASVVVFCSTNPELGSFSFRQIHIPCKMLCSMFLTSPWLGLLDLVKCVASGFATFQLGVGDLEWIVTLQFGVGDLEWTVTLQFGVGVLWLDRYMIICLFSCFKLGAMMVRSRGLVLEEDLKVISFFLSCLAIAWVGKAWVSSYHKGAHPNKERPQCTSTVSLPTLCHPRNFCKLTAFRVAAPKHVQVDLKCRIPYCDPKLCSRRLADLWYSRCMACGQRGCGTKFGVVL